MKTIRAVHCESGCPDLTVFAGARSGPFRRILGSAARVPLVTAGVSRMAIPLAVPLRRYGERVQNSAYMACDVTTARLRFWPEPMLTDITLSVAKGYNIF